MSVELTQFFDPKKVIQASTKECNLETCIKIVGMAKDIAPHGKTGMLKQSIGYAVPEKQEGKPALSVKPKTGEAVVGASVFYAIYIRDFTQRCTA